MECPFPDLKFPLRSDTFSALFQKLANELHSDAGTKCYIYLHVTFIFIAFFPMITFSSTSRNTPGTAQVGAISKARKIEGGAFRGQKKFAKKSHSAEKTRKGDPSLSSGSVGYVKKSRKPKGDPLVTKKSKKSHSAEKNGRGDLIMFSRTSVCFFLFCTRF